MSSITVFAGPIDIYKIIDFPTHTSVKSVLDKLIPELEEIFGDGVELVKTNDNRYDVDVSKVNVF